MTHEIRTLAMSPSKNLISDQVGNIDSKNSAPPHKAKNPWIQSMANFLGVEFS